VPQDSSSAATRHRLPDSLRTGLDLVFVGTASGHYSADVGAYYAHSGNRFWKTLHEVKFTSRMYQAREYSALLAHGIGFTDLSKVGVGMDHEVGSDQYDVAGFEAKMRVYKPRVIAFTSKKAASIWLGMTTSTISLGRQEAVRPDFPIVFVLPSSSGAAVRHWKLEPWQDLRSAVASVTA
jgi:TDG/mug DNA glycosylase family protein